MLTVIKIQIMRWCGDVLRKKDRQLEVTRSDRKREAHEMAGNTACETFRCCEMRGTH